MKAEIAYSATEFVQLLSSTRRGARLARRLAVQQLAEWGLPHDTECARTVELIVAELAANAVVHGHVVGRDFELRLVRTAGAVRVEVSDARGERLPCVARGAEDGEGGRGLVLVEALADRWGVRERDVGKTVWARVLV